MAACVEDEDLSRLRVILGLDCGAGPSGVARDGAGAEDDEDGGRLELDGDDDDDLDDEE